MSLPVRLLAAFALTHLVFATWPAIDLGVSRLFFDGEGFPLRGSAALEAVRQVIWAAVVATALGALAGWLVWAWLGPRARVPARAFGFVGLLFVLGPGLLVNGLLKAHWGRARPAEVEAFGGEAAFTPPFEVAGECARNCSFVSGEAAGAAALAIGLGALVPRLRPALALVAATASVLRVATGRHFASDVAFAWLLVAVVALGLWRALDMDRARPRLTGRALSHDLRLLARRLPGRGRAG